MEYLSGGELTSYWRKRGKIPEEETKEIMNQLFRAVEYCHNKNIVHRDLKF